MSNQIFPESFESILGRCKLDGEGSSYQQDAVRGLLRETDYVLSLTPKEIEMRSKNMKVGNAKEVLLKAPTGSGKTIMCGAYIETLFARMNKVIVLWISETPNLTKQSLEKFEAVFGLDTEFFEGNRKLELKTGQVIGINWEKIKNKKVREDGEQSDSIDTFLQKAKDDGYKIITIIDEAHSHADSQLSREFLAITGSDVIVHVTATPVRNYQNNVFVDVERVQRAGFIKQGVVVNDLKDAYTQEYRDATGIQSVTQYFLKQSLMKRDEIEQLVCDYANQTGKTPFVPLLVIQMPNNSNELMKQVEDYLDSEGYSRVNQNLAVYTSDDYTDELDEIGKNQDIKVLLFKQAISKGWDCPRASVITLLREPNRHHFVTQTIGRILRNPYLEVYPNDYDALNYGYVFIEETENQVLKQVVEGIQGQEIPLTLLRKPDIETELDLLKKVKLEKSKFNIKDKVREVVNLFKREVFGKDWLDSLDLNTTYLKSIESHTISARDVIESDEIVLDTGENEVSYELSNIDLSIEIDKYCRQNGINKDVLWSVLEDVVQPNLNNGLYSLKEILNIVLVNKDKFTLIFKQIFEEIEKTYENKFTELLDDWQIPSKWIVNKDYERILNMNEELYPYNEIWLDRNNLEVSFARMLDANPNVKLWYKNGDNGSKYFSLVYTLKGKPKSFYPDFLVETDDKLYILETKGRLDSEENIKKVEALARYKSSFDQTRDFDKQTKGLVVGYVKAHNNQFYIYTGSNFERDMNSLNNWELLGI